MCLKSVRWIDDLRIFQVSLLDYFCIVLAFTDLKQRLRWIYAVTCACLAMSIVGWVSFYGRLVVDGGGCGLIVRRNVKQGLNTTEQSLFHLVLGCCLSVYLYEPWALNISSLSW
ncbi:hypothetical protein KP509_1Z006100 [Ceratopteris richardii]|nr:hypothetical protein KP509_1Z006100 [Ceratopteris richardii]